jgi:hypothetical protein
MYSGRDRNHPGNTAKDAKKHICVRTKHTRILGVLGRDMTSPKRNAYVIAKDAKE